MEYGMLPCVVSSPLNLSVGRGENLVDDLVEQLPGHLITLIVDDFRWREVQLTVCSHVWASGQ